MSEQLPWIEKYRPQNLDDLSMPELTREAISSALNAGSAMPHMMFHGPSGTGKTSCSKIVAKSFFGCAKLLRTNTLELNASDERGIESIRQTVAQFALQQDFMSLLFDPSLAKNPMQPFKLVILDECDSLTSDAQAILRRVLEDSAKNCRFIFMCNNISKMIAPLISRCHLITFGRMDDTTMIQCLSRIVHKECLHFVGLDTLAALVETCDGDARQAINRLSLLSKSKEPSIDLVYKLGRRLPPPKVLECISFMLYEQDDAKRLLVAEQLMEKDLDVSCLLQDLATMAINILDGKTLVACLNILSASQERVSLGGSPILAIYSLIQLHPLCDSSLSIAP